MSPSPSAPVVANAVGEFGPAGRPTLDGLVRPEIETAGVVPWWPEPARFRMSRGSARGVAAATPPEIRYGSWGARPTGRFGAGVVPRT